MKLYALVFIGLPFILVLSNNHNSYAGQEDYSQGARSDYNGVEQLAYEFANTYHIDDANAEGLFGAYTYLASFNNVETMHVGAYLKPNEKAKICVSAFNNQYMYDLNEVLNPNERIVSVDGVDVYQGQYYCPTWFNSTSEIMHVGVSLTYHTKIRQEYLYTVQETFKVFANVSGADNEYISGRLFFNGHLFEDVYRIGQNENPWTALSDPNNFYIVLDNGAVNKIRFDTSNSGYVCQFACYFEEPDNSIRGVAYLPKWSADVFSVSTSWTVANIDTIYYTVPSGYQGTLKACTGSTCQVLQTGSLSSGSFSYSELFGQTYKNVTITGENVYKIKQEFVGVGCSIDELQYVYGNDGLIGKRVYGATYEFMASDVDLPKCHAPTPSSRSFGVYTDAPPYNVGNSQYVIKFGDFPVTTPGVANSPIKVTYETRGRVAKPVADHWIDYETLEIRPDIIYAISGTEFVNYVDYYHNPFDFSKPLTTDTTIYLDWDFVVDYVTEHGQAPPTQTILNSGRANQPYAPYAMGWEFLGWYLDEQLTNPFDFGTILNVNTTLYAKFDAVGVYMLNSHGNSSIEPETIINAGKLVKPTDPVDDNWTFNGWYLDNNTFANPYDFDQDFAGSTILYAKWSAVVIDHNVLNDDTTSQEIVLQGAVDNGQLITSYPNFNYRGQYLTQECASANEQDYNDATCDMSKWNISDNILGNMDLYARFSAIAVFIGGGYEPQERYADDLHIDNPYISRAGYYLNCFHIDSISGECFDFDTPLTGNTTLYVEELPIPYTIEFENLIDSDNIPDDIHTFWNTPITLSNISQTGYNFCGWTYESNIVKSVGTWAGLGFSQDQYSVKLTACFTPKLYRATYNQILR